MFGSCFRTLAVIRVSDFFPLPLYTPSPALTFASETHSLQVLRTRLSAVARLQGSRAFPVSGPDTWNDLPFLFYGNPLWTPSSLYLKTFLSLFQNKDLLLLLFFTACCYVQYYYSCVRVPVYMCAIITVFLGRIFTLYKDFSEYYHGYYYKFIYGIPVPKRNS